MESVVRGGVGYTSELGWRKNLWAGSRVEVCVPERGNGGDPEKRESTGYLRLTSSLVSWELGKLGPVAEGQLRWDVERSPLEVSIDSHGQGEAGDSVFRS